MARICYYHGTVKVPDFDDVMCMISYGDDNVFGLSQWAVDNKVIDTMCSNYTKFGMKYTDCAKDGVPRMMTIDEVEFLKRKFVWVDGFLRDPLPLVEIHDTLYWTKGKVNIDANLAERVEDVMEELVRYGRKVYDEHLQIIRQACAKFGISFKNKSYDTRMCTWIQKYYGVDVNLI
jgi:hypothetical protein